MMETFMHHAHHAHQMVFGDETKDTEVLKHCPYHAQIDAWRAFRDEFVENQGLVDMQEYEVRRAILSRQKAVGIEELIYHEDMEMTMSGIKRLLNVGGHYLHLYATIAQSDNWATEFHRIKDTNPVEFAMAAYSTFSTVHGLWADAQYAAAGKALADGLFPAVADKEGNIEWEPLPYDEPYAGEQIAGYVAGAIHQITGEANTDNLAECLKSQDTLLKSFEEGADSLMKRYNADIASGIAHLTATYQGLSSYADGCSQETQDQVAKLQESVVELDEETMMANLAFYKHHVELTYAKMKMTTELHDFVGYGEQLSEFYLTITRQ